MFNFRYGKKYKYDVTGSGGKGRGEQDDDRSSRRSLVVKPRKAYEQHCGTFCFFSRNCRVNGRPVDPVFLEIMPHCPGELASELL